MTESTEPRALDWFTPFRFGLLLALLVFAAFPQVFLGLETFAARDFGFFAYPLAHFQQSCLRHGDFPLWNPYNNCGIPFLAQWNTMPLYPPALFYLALPLKWSLGMFSLLHLWWAGFGMYFLARRWTGNNFAAAFAGTVFAFNGFTLNLIMWPSHIATFSWMPWVILATEMAWREGWQKIIVAAVVGAMQMLGGGPETIFLTWLIVSVLWLHQFIPGDISRPAMLWRYPLVVALVIFLTLPQLLPFLDLVAHSQREAGFADLRWSMPGSGLANFLVPTAFGTTVTEGLFFQHGQYWTSSYYLGLTAVWLAALALLCGRDKRVWLLGGMALIGLILALGENTPVLPLIRRLLPQLSFITYPIKYVMLVAFTAPLLAAFALANFDRLKGKILPVGAVLLSLILGIIIWTQSASQPGDNVSLALTGGLTRLGFLLLIGMLLIALARGGKSPLLRFAPMLLLLVAWTDVYTHEPTQNPTVPPWIFQTDLSREKLALNPQPELGASRVMVSPQAWHAFLTFAASNPQDNFLVKRLGYCANCNLLDAVPKVDGFFSLTPKENDAVLSLFYATTNASHPGLENFMGVSQLTAADAIYHWQARTNFLPLVTAGQAPLFLTDDQALSTLIQPGFDGSKVVLLPPEEKSFVTATNAVNATILSRKFGINSVDIIAQAAAPALVVVAQTWYHNWQAEVDRKPARLLRANVAFQAVEIPAGEHEIRLRYQDRLFGLGAVISGFMWLNCFISYVAIKRRFLPPAEPDPDEEDNYL